MRIGLDVDGVLADFIPAYQALVVRMTGKDLFKPGDDVNPPCWDWPQFRGYTDTEIKAVWAQIIADPEFWSKLKPLEGCDTLALCFEALSAEHDLYFITARPGARAKAQSEYWLWANVAGFSNRYPTTVLISPAKGLCARALKLDAYIDDNLDNALSVASVSPATRTYLLDRNYNQSAALPAEITRVRSVGQMLDYELNNL